ncbi:MAG: hypothetical protein IPN16_13315 [Gemmatimonadetes bacterium]|nr:hypothetical protein [Gemmatimonadota bacterium]
MADTSPTAWIELMLTFFALVFVSVLTHDLLAGHLGNNRSVAVLSAAVLTTIVGVSRQFQRWWGHRHHIEGHLRRTAILLWCTLVLAFVSGHIFVSELLALVRGTHWIPKILFGAGTAYLITTLAARQLARSFPQLVHDRRRADAGGHR